MAKLGFGITLSRGDGATPEVFADPIGELVDFTPPSQTRETKDATHHGSVNRIRQSIGGMRDPGEAAFVLHFEPGGSAWDDLQVDYLKDDPVNYKVTFPGGGSVIIPGLITELSPATPMEDVMKLSGKMKAAGASTWS